MAAPRMRRVNEVLREVVGAAIVDDLSDPRIGFVTVTSVETSPDLRSAKVYVSVLGDEAAREETLAGLRASHGVLQSRMCNGRSACMATKASFSSANTGSVRSFVSSASFCW